jgi:hypothetical protein
LLEAFEREYRMTIPQGSNGADLVARLKITLPQVWMAQAQTLASSMACGGIDRETFDLRAEALITQMESRILRVAPQGEPTSVGEVCLRHTTSINAGTEPLRSLCERTSQLVSLRTAKRFELRCAVAGR